MKKAVTQDRCFESMGQAAGALSVDLEVLKKAKRAGCPAFKPGGRVQEKVLLAWISKNSDALKAGGDQLSLKEQKLNEEIRKLKIRNDRDEGKLVSRQTVCEAVRRILGGLPALSEQRLVNEYPSAVAGLDVPQARVYGKRVHDELMTGFRDFAVELEKL